MTSKVSTMRRPDRRRVAYLAAAIALLAIVGPAIAVDPLKKSDASPTGKESPVSPLEWFAKQANAVWSIIFTASVIVLVTGAVVVVRREYRRTAMVIDPIEVPVDLAAKGYTPLVVAQRIAAELSALQRTARVQRRLEDAVELSTLQIDFTVPTAGISYRTLIRYVRQSFGRPEQRVRGEIVRGVAHHLGLTAGEVSTDPLRIVLRALTGEQTSPSLTVDSEAELPDLLKRAAFEIAVLVDPYLIAAYWFRIEQGDRRFDKTLEAVSRCLRLTPAKEHHKAYATWGNVLLAQRRFAEAEQKFRIAVALAPGVSAAHTNYGNLLRAMRQYDAAARRYQHAQRLDRRDAAAWSNLGNVYNDRRLHEKAINCFQRALRIDPRFVPALSGSGYALWRLGRIEEAEEHFARAGDIDPRFGWSYLNWARLLRFQRRYDDAIAKVMLAAETLPADAYTVWGEILVDLGRPEEAKAKYEQAAVSNPELGNGLAGIASLYRRQGRAIEAIEKARLALEVNPYHLGAWETRISALRLARQHDAAIEACRAFLALDPYQAVAYIHWGHTLLAQQRARQAMSYFSAAANVDRTESGAWQGWGDALMEAGRPRAALRKYQHALTLNRWNSAAYVGAGRALAALGRHVECDDRYRTALEVDPRNDWVHRAWAQVLVRRHRQQDALNRIKTAVEVALQPADSLALWGDILVDLGRFQEAQEKYEECTKADPNSVRGTVGVAYLLQRTGRHLEAIAKAAEALTIDPEDAAAWNRSTGALRQSGRYDEAIAQCGKLLEIRPRSSLAYQAWGLTLHAQHRLDEALRQLKHAIRLDPYNAWNRYSLGEVFLHKRQYERAANAFQRATLADPWNTSAWVRLGECKAALGRFDEALALYRRAYESDPGDSWAWHRLAVMLWSLDHRSEADEMVRGLVESPPQEAGLLRRAAEVLMWTMNRKAEAARMYRQAALLDPRDVWAWRGLAAATVDAPDRTKAINEVQKIVAAEPWNEDAYRVVAMLLESRGDGDTALECLARGATAAPQSVALLMDWASALSRRAASTSTKADTDSERLYSMAEAKLQQANQLDPWNPEPSISWGWQLLTRKRYDLALDRFESALRRDRYSEQAWWGKGRVLAELKRYRRSARAYKRALRYGPNRETIQQDLASLEALRRESALGCFWWRRR